MPVVMSSPKAKLEDEARPEHASEPPPRVPGAPALLQATNLQRNFGRICAVEDISLRAGPGDIVALLGANGAGKSTTLRMIVGSLRPDAGSVRIVGVDPQREPLAARRAFGYLPEGAPAYPEMRVRDMVSFSARLRGASAADARAQTGAALERLGLVSVARQRIDTLSKGFKRRVGLAMAILHAPPLLLLDEPTDGLDPNQKHEVRTLLQEISAGGGRAVVLSTHLLEEVEAVCNRAVVIARGRVVFNGTPAELEALAPAAVTRRRLDHVFRELTAGPASTAGGAEHDGRGGVARG